MGALGSEAVGSCAQAAPCGAAMRSAWVITRPQCRHAVRSSRRAIRRKGACRLKRRVSRWCARSASRRPEPSPPSLCYSSNRVACETTSELDAAPQHLELDVILQPQGGLEEQLVLHLSHSTPPARFAPARQRSAAFHGPADGAALHVDALYDELQGAGDVASLSARVQWHARRLQQHHIRAALGRLLQLQRQSEGRSDGAAERRAAAQSCMDALLLSVRSPHTTAQPSACSLSDWPAPDVVLLARAMASVPWFEPGVWAGVIDATSRASPLIQPHQASALMWAAARLHQCAAAAPPPDSWLDAMLSRVAAGAGGTFPSTIAQALYAAARLGGQPCPSTLRVILDAGVQARLPVWLGQDLACVLWALAAMGHHPGDGWLSAVLARAEACVHSFVSGSAVASTLWALAVLGHAPPRPWMEHFLWQVQRRMSACNAHALTNVVWALGRLRYRPPNAWAAALLRAAAQRMHALPPALIAAAADTVPSTAGARQAGQPATVARLPSTTATAAGASAVTVIPQQQQPQSQSPPPQPQHAPIVLWPLEPGPPATHSAGNAAATAPAVAVPLGPGRSHRPQVAQHAGTVSADVDGQPRGLRPAAAQPGQLPALRHPALPRPEPMPAPSTSQQQQAGQSQQQGAAGMDVSMAWLGALWEDPVAWKGPGASPHAFVGFLAALARLQLCPRARYLRRMCAAMAFALPAFSARDATVCLWALQRLRFVPDEPWHAALCSVLAAKLPSADNDTVVIALGALGRYATVRRVDPTLLQSLYGALLAALPSMGAQSTAAAAVAVARLARAASWAVPSPLLHASLLSRVVDHLPGMGVRSASNCALAAARLAACGADGAGAPPPALAVSIVQHAARLARAHISTCNQQDLAQVVMACAEVRWSPGTDWLAAHEAAACRAVVQAGGRAVLTLGPLLLDAYVALGYEAPRLQRRLAVALSGPMPRPPAVHVSDAESDTEAAALRSHAPHSYDTWSEVDAEGASDDHGGVDAARGTADPMPCLLDRGGSGAPRPAGPPSAAMAQMRRQALAARAAQQRGQLAEGPASSGEADAVAPVAARRQHRLTARQKQRAWQVDALLRSSPLS